MPDVPLQVVSEFQPLGDQPQAIDALAQSVSSGQKYQTLMGVTGSGKTFTMANVIARCQKPALVISHNKTLAAQLYEEFKELLPNNAVSYFVSYYDYYQPEAYIPQRDIYIEKDSSRNDDLDRLRLATTTNLSSRRDVVVVASVSCIFGLGSPDFFKKSVVSLTKGQRLDRQDFLRALSDLQYSRAEMEFKRGSFRVRGDVVEIRPASEEIAYRIELFGDTLDNLSKVDPVSGELIADETQLFIYPAVHYVVPENQIEQAVTSITEELDRRVLQLRGEGKLLEAQRLTSRTRYDLELIREVGVCPGIENYSRHLDGRPPGAKPYTLMDYFPENDWLMLIDESHVTLPQMHAMYHGDRHRKETLVEHGFRLPSAMDNRPLRYEEIEKLWPQVVFVSATPGPYELQKSGGVVVEQVIRPTGLVDPRIEIRPAGTQVPDVCAMVKERAARNERALVTTLTKRMAEQLATYMAEQGLRCRYLHSDIETLERISILRDLRLGDFDVLVGVNLLREGLDLPEVSLVGITDSDKEGFLRSATSLIQQIGRAARNVNALVVLYADKVTPAMKQAIDETDRRRSKQLEFNAANGITPQTIKKAIRHGIEQELKAHRIAREAIRAPEPEYDRAEILAALEGEMLEAAQALQFEKAAAIRDKIKTLKDSPDLGPVTMEQSQPAKVKPGTPGTRVMRGGKKRRSTHGG
ncbi:MAG: excinuclease ABC subunit UvrB [Planctomycetota bacterium]|nr:excinuclease ABC subunit UvrB [Planctomycetota bacterium]